jgi:hypothetical protein
MVEKVQLIEQLDENEKKIHLLRHWWPLF